VEVVGTYPLKNKLQVIAWNVSCAAITFQDCLKLLECSLGRDLEALVLDMVSLSGPQG
jgi:hypothetical protein